MDRNEAIKVIKDNWPESRHQLSEALQTLIPELRESKGERIRKEIIQFLQLPHPQFVGKRNHEEWIAWLENEKQGKQLEYNWSKEDIMHFNRCLGYIDAYVEPRRDDVEWFKSLKDRIKGKQKSVWSEEDYDEIGVIACHLDNMGNEAMAKSLLCIRDKYNSVKPKQEWSEEDEEMIDAVIADIQFTQKAHTHEVNQVVYEREIDWLKSLKERYAWKPSDEQMNLLEYLVEDNNQRYFYNILRSLYEQLKKLKEE